MNDEYESPIDFQSLLMKRIMDKKTEQPTSYKSNGFDPYKSMIDRKNGNYVPQEDIKSWPEEDIKNLEDFCKKYGLIGVSCGKMPPSVVLHMLKQKMGVLDEKNVNYPYQRVDNKKSIIHG